MPSVTIVTNFLNPGEFLNEAVESVLRQTHESWQLILVDDGSTDGSTQLAQRFATEHGSRITYVEHDGHQNRGMSVSRNLGVSCGTGEYIAFLDADDAWLPSKLDEQVRILQLHPDAALVSGATRHWYSWQAAAAGDHQADWIQRPPVEPDTIVGPPLLLTLALDGKGFCNTSNFMVRAGAFREVGGFDREFLGLFEDLAFLSKIFLWSNVYISGAVWENYRHHPASACAVAERSPHGYDAPYLLFLDWLEEYLVRGGITDGSVWRALRERRRLIIAGAADSPS